MTRTESCDICRKPGTTVAYFATGMAAVVYRHHECDRAREQNPPRCLFLRRWFAVGLPCCGLVRRNWRMKCRHDMWLHFFNNINAEDSGLRSG
jgi:hypothetical protein